MKKSFPLSRILTKNLPGLVVLFGVAPAQAKQDGQNFACVNCHEGRDYPEVSATFAAPRVEPGQSVGLTVTTTHDTALVGGVLVDSLGVGSFEIVDPAETHFFEEVTTQVTHTMPKAFTAGEVEFTFTWVAPDTVGPVEFEIWGNAANDNLDAHDDSAAGTTAHIAVGCDGLWYYPDADGDGAGEDESGVFSCEPVPDTINEGGDCDDENPAVNVGVTEVCNETDDNCDGEVDEGFERMLFAEDLDGDGYGALTGETKIGCLAPPGFGVGFDDCDDANPAVNPGAMEVMNGIDDNCNGQRDEASVAPSGTGGAPPAPEGSGGMPAAAGGSVPAPIGGGGVPAAPVGTEPVAPGPVAPGAPSAVGTVDPGPGSPPGDDSGCSVRTVSQDSSGGAPIIIASLALLARLRRARRTEPSV